MFISYAQNFEDVMLWRALKHIKEGFYVDVGAGWPEKDSVTKAFYDHGWSGINIEPNPELWRLLSNDRPRDLNLRVALADRPGRRELHVISGTGLSSLSSDLAASHNARGFHSEEVGIEVSTLSDVWREHVGSQDVHFLKIDVEGAELQVLQGNDWSRFRPWIIVIEATIPLTQIRNQEEWEPIILSSQYLTAYDDGLNRFYVAEERREILSAFSHPPNVFDEFVSAHQFDTEARLQQAESRVTRVEENAASKLLDAEKRIQEAESRATRVEENAAAKLFDAEKRIQRAESRATQVEENAASKLLDAEKRNQEAESRATWVEENAAAKLQEAETRVLMLEQRLRNSDSGLRDALARAEKQRDRRKRMKESISWRITKPIRWVEKWRSKSRTLPADASSTGGTNSTNVPALDLRDLRQSNLTSRLGQSDDPLARRICNSLVFLSREPRR